MAKRNAKERQVAWNEYYEEFIDQGYTESAAALMATEALAEDDKHGQEITGRGKKNED